jgi:hypothetical protein
MMGKVIGHIFRLSMEYHNKRQTKEWQEMHKPGQVVVLLAILFLEWPLPTQMLLIYS